MMGQPAWGALGARYPKSWIDYLREVDDEGQSLVTTSYDLAGIEVEPADRERHPDLEKTALELLEGLVEVGWTERSDPWPKHYCPICDYEIPEDHSGTTCPNPDGSPHDFTDQEADGPYERFEYQRQGVARRYVGWLLALHGMNTRGSWQESFNWLVSTSYGRMVPVAIYKYGVVRPGVLSRGRHKTLRARLVARIQRASQEASQIVSDPRPDVIAHSFGTLLLGHTLHENPEIKVARVITLGCILRPDFDWATLIERGQVEAVLNHHGTADQWAKRAHAAIPDAGPAGRRGFDLHKHKWPAQYQAAPPLFNVPAQDFTHSEFFEDKLPRPTKLTKQFRNVWQPFLTTRDIADVGQELERRGNKVSWPADTWQQNRWPRRALTGGWRRAPYTYADRR